MKVLTYYDEVTPVSQAVSWNTHHIYGRLVSVHIKPTTSSTTYHFAVTSAKGFVIYETLPLETGELNQAIDCALVDGIYSCTISSASVDELFTIQFDIEGNE